MRAMAFAWGIVLLGAASLMARIPEGRSCLAGASVYWEANDKGVRPVTTGDFIGVTVHAVEYLSIQGAELKEAGRGLAFDVGPGGETVDLVPFADEPIRVVRYYAIMEIRVDRGGCLPCLRIETPEGAVQTQPVTGVGKWQKVEVLSIPHRGVSDARVMGKIGIQTAGEGKVEIRNLALGVYESFFVGEAEDGFQVVNAQAWREDMGMSGMRFSSVAANDLTQVGYTPLHHFAFVGWVRWKEVVGKASFQATGVYPSPYDGSEIRFCRTAARGEDGSLLALQGDGDWRSFFIPIEHADLLTGARIPNGKSARWDIDQTLEGSGVVFLRNPKLIEYPDDVWQKLPPAWKVAWGTDPVSLPAQTWKERVLSRLRFFHGRVVAEAAFGLGILVGVGGAVGALRLREAARHRRREKELRRIASLDSVER